MDADNRGFIVACLSACGAAMLICCCVALCGILFFGLLAGTVPQAGLLETLSAQVTIDINMEGLPTIMPPSANSPVSPVDTPVGFDPLPALTALAPDPTVAAAQSAGMETLQLLENTIVPVNDPLELATRLKGLEDPVRSLEQPERVYAVNDQRSFWVTDTDTNDNREIDATLTYISKHVYFWVQDGVETNPRHVQRLIDTFDDQIYPRNREFFGSEWLPGVDGDPRLFILYTRGLGGSVAGYFSSADSYLPDVREKSNAAEMFVLSADHVDLDEEFAYGVLAHEFQHMIHWYRDRNEETWVNEGFSDLAMFLNGYTIGGADNAFVSDPDLQLNDWPADPVNRSANYGAAFMFVNYFLTRFGEDATKALVADPANGMVSIDSVLANMGAKDPGTNAQIGADDVFADWVLTNYLLDESIGDGRFIYADYPSAPSVFETESISECPFEQANREVSQYGADYIELRCAGDYTLRFAAPTLVNALPIDPHSGEYAFYSNRGDESDMSLMRSFDFSAQSGDISLSYWTWYDLENDYDYLYLLASEDGQTWQFIETPSGTDEDPVGNSYGWGYNGQSGGGPQWIEETVDLSQFAGKQVQLRFEYITDAAVNGEGFLLDDIAIPAIDYATDFEQDDGGWQADGFVRLQNVLPQTYRVSLIYIGDDMTVEYVPLPESNVIEIPLSIGGDIDRVVVVVSGTSRFTRQKAFYQFSLLPR